MVEILSKLSESLADTVALAGTGVVRVEGRGRLPASGIVWSSDGVVVTAHHVVERDENIKVGLPDGSTVSATLVGRDPSTDLAVLRVQGVELAQSKQAELEKLRVGHLVLALGRPGKSVRATLGIVSALGQEWVTPAGGRLDCYLQTDVVMYPGFSGGPLVDVDGKVLGLNTSALARGRSITVPVLSIGRVVESLLAHGRVRRGYIGVGAQYVRLPESLAQHLGQETGLLLVSVESDSPAEEAGLVLGDTIVSIDGQVVRKLEDLRSHLDADRIGSTIPLRVVRGGQLQELKLVVGERA